LEFSSLLKQAPSELIKSDTKLVTKSAAKTKKSKPQEATLDLFSQVSDDTTPLPLRYHYDDVPMMESKESLEGRLVNYLLNPEVAYNPALPIQWDKLKEDSSLWNLYNDVELPLSQVLKEMQDAGVRIDVPMLKMAEEQLTQELLSIEQEIYSSVGLTFNVNSPKQVGEVLFDHLKLDAKAKKSKTGQYSTSEEVLLALKPKHPVVGMILEYRELKKLISTYISALPTYINPDTGKIHTTYNQTVTATGRLSSSNPNLQNLPIRSERGQLIRQAVIPDDGCLFLSADYSQIELRLMAHFSQDPHLVQAFRSGQDIHAATAAKIFNVPIEEVTKDQRRQAKTANFGIIYGISAFGLAQQLDCSRSEAKALIDGYFAAFPGVIDYIERQKELARRQGYAVTLFGRKRYLPDIVSHNATVRSFAERNAVNSPIQGTAADIIKMAMVTIHQRLKEEGLKAQMIMQVHDELNFNVPENEVDRVREIVVSEMQNVVHLTVPLIADCGVGENWLQAH
jgi:DNA polymerase-1